MLARLATQEKPMEAVFFENIATSRMEVMRSAKASLERLRYLMYDVHLLFLLSAGTSTGYGPMLTSEPPRGADYRRRARMLLPIFAI
jgi:hypothetical protein